MRSCKEYLLFGTYSEPLGQIVHLLRGQVLGAFGNYDDIGPAASLHTLAQIACGEHGVIHYVAVPVDQQYVERGLDPAVLERVIQDDDLRVTHLDEASYALGPVGADCHLQVRKTAFYLKGFVADESAVGVGIGHEETFGVAAVSAAQHCGLVAVLEQGGGVFGVRGLAGPAYGYVADTDYGKVKNLAFTQAFVVETVPDSGNQTVEPSQGTKCVVYFEFGLHYSVIIPYL